MFVAANVTALALVLYFVVGTRSSGDAQPLAARAVNASSVSAQAVVNPLDQVSSADIALTVSRMTGLAETTAITNQADSADISVATAASSNSVVSKPEVVATAFKSNKDIQTYVVQPGDSVESIAAKFSVTSNSIKWSNNLGSNTVNPGAKLLIPPVGYSGIVYTVKAGDTLQSLAAKYKAGLNELTAANDAEISGIHVGEQIIIPGGQEPAPTYYSYSSYGFPWGGAAVYGYNGYDYGYCTWWVAQRRAQVGKPLPSNLGNASSWPYIGRLAGLAEGHTPRPYAAAVTSLVGEGHVAFVEAVNSDGSVTLSEMNVYGWDVKDTRTVSAAQAAGYIYIY
ncbi:MAG TPA: LysM peptidoglycan-binding domain-containing protein [Candidatus Saccharimonadales bacterium]